MKASWLLCKPCNIIYILKVMSTNFKYYIPSNMNDSQQVKSFLTTCFDVICYNFICYIASGMKLITVSWMQLITPRGAINLLPLDCKTYDMVFQCKSSSGASNTGKNVFAIPMGSVRKRTVSKVCNLPVTWTERVCRNATRPGVFNAAAMCVAGAQLDFAAEQNCWSFFCDTA